MPALIAPAIAAGLGISAGSASLIAGLVFTVGPTLLTFLLAPKPEDPSGSVPFKQPIQPRGFGYGRTRVAGATMLYEANEGNLLKVQALLSHRCHGFGSFFLHDDEGTLGIGGANDLDNYFQFPGKPYGTGNGRVRIFTNLGMPSETAFSEIVSRIPMWTSSHRGDGICSLGMICHDSSAKDHPRHYPYGHPLPSAEVYAALVYDPRDEDQDPDDESTWAWSDNPALCILHFMCFSEFGFQRDYTTSVLPYVESWKTAADDCDALVDLNGGGTEKRYRLGGNATTEHSPRTVLAQMMAACDGWMVDRGDGGIDFRAGVFEEPEIILTDDDIVGFDLPYGIADEEVVNRLDVTFTDPDTKFTERDVDPWQNEADQTARGAVREHRLPLTWVPSPTQARRLGFREYTRLQEPLRGTLDLRLEAIDAVYARWIRVRSATIPQLLDKVIENRAGHLSLLSGSVRIAFIGSGSHIDDWNESDDEGATPEAPDTPPDQGLPALENVSFQVIYSSDGSEATGLQVSFDAPSNHENLSFLVTWIWSTDDGSFSKSQEFPAPHTVSDGRIHLITDSSPQSGTVTIAVVSVGSDGAVGDSPVEGEVVVDTTVETLLATAGEDLRATTTDSLRAI